MMALPRKLSTQWTKHIKDTKKKKEFEGYVYGSSGVLEVLKDILENKLLEVSKSAIVDYSQAAWPYRQADKVGYARAMSEVLTLINLENKT